MLSGHCKMLSCRCEMLSCSRAFCNSARSAYFLELLVLCHVLCLRLNKLNLLILGMVGINEGLISAAEAAFGGIKVPKHILIANFKCVNFFPIYINKNLLKTEIFSHYRLYLLNKMLVKKSLIGS